MSAPSADEIYFRISPDDLSIEVDEGSGNGFFLGPVLRKYTAARLTVHPKHRVTTVEITRVWDALGLLRSLQYDVDQFNAAATATAPTPSSLRYQCFRLNRQAAAFGVRVPRAGEGFVAVPGLDSLVSFLEERYAPQLERSRALLSAGLCDFDSLAEMYKPGTDLLDRGACTGLFGTPTAFRVRACYYSRGKSLFGVVTTFYAAIECVVAVGSRFAVVESTLPINDFAGTRSVHEGFEHMIVLGEAMREDLSKRGLIYSTLCAGNAYMEYAPGTFTPSPKASGAAIRGLAARARGGGRMMIDTQAALSRGISVARSEGCAAEAVRSVLKLMATRERQGAIAAAAAAATAATSGVLDASGSQASAFAEQESLELLLLADPLPESLLCLTWPLVTGFSFAAKCWGAATVSGLSDIFFNAEAFKRLVLPASRKNLIAALVGSYRADDTLGGVHSTDVMAGKGEGTIFLLHGPPGCGKTLTAEAVAESLHKPLYVVSMGELGTTPEALEERLMEVLELCASWGAIVLIDEAEMLLETRTSGDIVRNAMVCVMLRLLEYYHGILFLTTNRVSALDPAFQSRVQCALRYDALDQASRSAIWADLLRRAGAGAELQADALANHELNGRQIKNVLQLALALSRHEGVPVNQSHLDSTLEMTAAFVAETSGR